LQAAVNWFGCDEESLLSITPCQELDF
jgi:hypothetical protein